LGEYEKREASVGYRWGLLEGIVQWRQKTKTKEWEALGYEVRSRRKDRKKLVLYAPLGAMQHSNPDSNTNSVECGSCDLCS
jgi:hypothetical protein